MTVPSSQTRTFGSTTPTPSVGGPPGALTIATLGLLPRNSEWEIAELLLNTHGAADADLVVEDNLGNEFFRAHVTTEDAHLFQKGPNKTGLGLKITKNPADRTLLLRAENVDPNIDVDGYCRIEQVVDDPADAIAALGI